MLSDDSLIDVLFQLKTMNLLENFILKPEKIALSQMNQIKDVQKQ